MDYTTYDPTEMMGIGSYVGEVRQGSDGNLYEWAEGVDGLGNPVGFWKKLVRTAGRGLKRLAKRVIPKAAGFIPGVGPIAQQAASGLLRGVHEDPTEMMGIGGYVGEIRQGPDGNLYQWAQGVDGLGNPVGFWKKLVRTAGAGLKRLAKRVIPKAAGFIPGVGPIAQQVATGLLRGTGLHGVHGPILESPDGRHYEQVDGLGSYGEPYTELRPVRLVRTST